MTSEPTAPSPSVDRFVRGRCIAERFTTPDDQHDITAGTKRQAFSRRSTIIMPSHFRQHGIIDGMAISTPDKSEGIDVVGETPSPFISDAKQSSKRTAFVAEKTFQRISSRRKTSTEASDQDGRTIAQQNHSRRKTQTEGHDSIARTIVQRKHPDHTSVRAPIVSLGRPTND